MSCFSCAVSEPKLATKRGKSGDKLKYANSLKTQKIERTRENNNNIIIKYKYLFNQNIASLDTLLTTFEAMKCVTRKFENLDILV